MKYIAQVIAAILLAGLVGCSGSAGTQNSKPSSTDDPKKKIGESQPHDTDNNGKKTKRNDSTGPRNSSTDSTKIPEPADPQQAALRRQVAKLAGRDGNIDETAKKYIEERGDQARDYVLTLLQDPSVDVRRGAAFFLLEQFNATDTREVAAFQAILSDGDSTIRHIALQAIQRIPTNDLKAAAPQLVALLERKDESTANRAKVARLIAKLKADGREVLPALARATSNDPDATVRKACLFAVSQIAEPAESVAVYRKVLTNDSDAGVRLQAVLRLGKLGPHAAAAANDLIGTFEDKDEKVQKAAAEAMAKIGAMAIPRLVKQLESNNANTRQLAVYALGKMGNVAKPAIPALQKMLDDEDENVRRLAEAVISSIQSSR